MVPDKFFQPGPLCAFADHQQAPVLANLVKCVNSIEDGRIVLDRSQIANTPDAKLIFRNSELFADARSHRQVRAESFAVDAVVDDGNPSSRKPCALCVKVL